MLDVQNLGVSFGGEVLFESFSFRIGRGDRIGLIGKNGAGKSTFVDVAAGLLKPTQGTFSVDGEKIDNKFFLITLVASNLPPSPTSKIFKSALFLLKIKKAAAVIISKNVIFEPSPCGTTWL